LSARNITHAKLGKLIKVILQRTLSARNVTHAKVLSARNVTHAKVLSARNITHAKLGKLIKVNLAADIVS
jgi:hypothetical protein